MESPSALTARTSEQGLLPSLPYELLAAVCEYLDPPSLRALSLTCRKAVLPANDVLYQGYNNLSSGRKRLHLFLRTLVQQPELAAKIKSIELSGWVTETELEEGRSRVWNEQLEDITSPRESSRWSDVANIKSNAIPARDMFSRARTVNRVDRTNDDLELFALFLDAAQNLGFVSRDREYDPGIYRTRKRRWAIASNGGDLVRNLAKNIEDAHVFLILASVPNLESLSIREMRPFKTLNWSCFFRKSNTALNSLKKLHIFRSYMGGQWDGGKLASYRSLDQFLNYMPQLTDLNLVGIVGVDGWKISKRRRSTGGANTKLSKVTLVDSEFTEGFFAWLLSGTDSITEFTCLFESQTFWLNYQEVIDQLAGSKDTLQSLTLDEASPLSDYNPTSLANLSHFERLESLAAPHQCLFPKPEMLIADQISEEDLQVAIILVLPTSLKTLVIYRADASIDLTLYQLALLCKVGQFPNLREIGVEHFDPAEDYDGLQDDFGRIGVKIRIVPKQGSRFALDGHED